MSAEWKLLYFSAEEGDAIGYILFEMYLQSDPGVFETTDARCWQYRSMLLTDWADLFLYQEVKSLWDKNFSTWLLIVGFNYPRSELKKKVEQLNIFETALDR